MAMTRREARERVFELLYELEMKGISAQQLLSDLPVGPEEWVASYVTRVDEESSSLDEVLASKLRGDWALDRIALTDRLLLRMGLWELVNGDAPRAVVLAEAVELAKRYGGEASGRFVNGLLAAAAEDSPSVGEGGVGRS